MWTTPPVHPHPPGGWALRYRHGVIWRLGAWRITRGARRKVAGRASGIHLLHWCARAAVEAGFGETVIPGAQMLRDALRQVLDSYRPIRGSEEFAGNPMAAHLRTGIPSILESITPDADSYLFKGSAGQGQWAACPWVAVLDPDVTVTPQLGFYPVYLFAEDGSYAYLSLNQGVSQLLKEHGTRDARNVLAARSAQYRALLGPIPAELMVAQPIHLAGDGKSAEVGLYELGHICGARYDAGQLPTEDRMVSDYRVMISLYQQLAGLVDPESAATVPAAGASLVEDYTRSRKHDRLDRNPLLSKKAKECHGFVCQACGVDLEQLYGSIGASYIEAHHLVPVSSLRGRVMERDPRTDFAVLCPNCHAMIHKTDAPHDLEGLRRRLNVAEFGRLAERL